LYEPYAILFPAIGICIFVLLIVCTTLFKFNAVHAIWWDDGVRISSFLLIGWLSSILFFMRLPLQAPSTNNISFGTYLGSVISIPVMSMYFNTKFVGGPFKKPLPSGSTVSLTKRKGQETSLILQLFGFVFLSLIVSIYSRSTTDAQPGISIAEYLTTMGLMIILVVRFRRTKIYA